VAVFQHFTPHLGHIPATFLWMDTQEFSEAPRFSAIGIRGRLSPCPARAVCYCRDALKEQPAALTLMSRDRNLAPVDADNDADETDLTIRIAPPGQNVMVAELLRDCFGAWWKFWGIAG